MKKLVLMVAAVAAMVLTSCNEKAESATIEQANLTAAAANKEVAGDFQKCLLWRLNSILVLLMKVP